MAPAGIFGTQRPRTVGAQFADVESAATVGDDDGGDSTEHLPKVTYQRKTFVLEKAVAKKGSRGRSSWIKNEGWFVVELLPGNKQGVLPIRAAISDLIQLHGGHGY